MKFPFLLFGLVVALSTPGVALADASSFAKQCQALLSALDTKTLPKGDPQDSFGVGYCLGTLSSLHMLSEATGAFATQTGTDDSRLICADRFIAKDFASHVIEYVERTPEAAKSNEMVTAIQALMNAYPCPGKSAITGH